MEMKGPGEECKFAFSLDEALVVRREVGHLRSRAGSRDYARREALDTVPRQLTTPPSPRNFVSLRIPHRSWPCLPNGASSIFGRRGTSAAQQPALEGKGRVCMDSHQCLQGQNSRPLPDLHQVR